jgi:tetratricopeptide (TPR) repeat protein
MELGSPGDALEWLSLLTKTHQDNPISHIAMGDTSLQLCRYPEALESYDKAIHLDSKQYYAYKRMGDVHQALGDLSEAEYFYR